ncbi:MAG: MFS transporter [Erysipelotrichia bacterium]|nr:MFS transporter [Erysipelotrichia bacterium]
MKKESRIWISLLLFGFLGQLAWTVENMYFNVFVYNTLSGDVNVIASMVALSAITATLTTMLMGSLSDKLGKRKIFIVLGYFIWGLSVIVFAFLNTDNISALFPYKQAALLGGQLAVLMDCIMTFFGSTANDACFNAWLTETVDNSSRSKFESVIAALPLIAMLVIFGLLDPLTQKGHWDIFFIIIGTAVSLGGIIGIFILKDEVKVKNKNSFLTNLTYGFKLKNIRENKELYLALLTSAVFSVSTQIFMPYMIIYIQAYLQISNYALILGIVLIVSSLISVLIGSVIDKIGASKFYIPAIILLTGGLLMMYFSRKPLAVILSGIVMMSGNLLVTSLVNGSIRNNTPNNRAGSVQGLRMIFTVMLPMIIGPFIGAAVIKNSGMTYEELGVIKQVPSANIWLAAAICAALIFIPYHFYNQAEKQKKTKHNNLLTSYGEKLDVNNVLPEYPRPQMQRKSFINLNGLWQYAINRSEELPQEYDGDIVVPFSPESILSQVNKTVTAQDILWYKKTFILPQNFNEGLVYLHFGAVDQICQVYLNGKMIKEHIGGYLPFDVDITDYLQDENELIVKVVDYTDKSYYSRGKQSSKRGGIWYTPTSGIWQTVWLESMPKEHIRSLKININYDSQLLNLIIYGDSSSYTVTIKEKNNIIFKDDVAGSSSIHIENMHSWSPEDPFLYDLIITNGQDEIKSYFGMRKFSVGFDKAGKKRLFLNNKPYFHKGVLDQGYYSDGIYTPASYQQMQDDIQMLKDMGFNTIRKHIKIEPLYFYYLCDKMGMLVWQDMVNGGGKYSFLTIAALPYVGIEFNDHHYNLFARKSQQSRDMYLEETKETVELLYNCVSLSLWVPFNEGWGQFDALNVTKMIKSLDNSRIIDHASGWHDQKGGDLCSKHIYFQDIKFNKDDRVWALTEYGGYSQMIKNHSYNDAAFGYKLFNNQIDLQSAFLQLHTEQIIPLIKDGLSATIYTQLSDVEDEVNGLVTYDRKVVKFDKKFMKKINDQLSL